MLRAITRIDVVLLGLGTDRVPNDFANLTRTGMSRFKSCRT